VNTPYRDPRTLVDWDDLDLGPILDIQTTPVTEAMPAIRSRLVWDLVPDDKVLDWAAGLGINRPSVNVASYEAASAGLRRAMLEPFATILMAMATTSAEVISAARIMGRAESDPAPGSTLVVVPDDDETGPAVMAAAVAIIANLIDLDVLTFGKALEL